jgi:hypothetical protein
MNVTLKLPDNLCREARHRAVDAGLSLSGWVSSLIAAELARNSAAKHQTLGEALGCDALDGLDIEFPREKGGLRPVDLS